MGQVIVTVLVLWAALAVGTGLWMWLHDRWSRYQRPDDACACGLYSLDGINGQRTSVAIHRRELCAPHREMIP